MSSNFDERPVFYEDQYLGADDLNTAVGYARGRLARHILGAHTWGIAAGLELVERVTPGGTDVEYVLTPGYAWDGFGRVLAALEPTRLPPDAFSAYKFDTAIDSAGTGRLVEVWIRYWEDMTRAEAAGFAPCETAGRQRRALETFRFVVGAQAAPEGQVQVFGRPTNAEEAHRRFNPAAALIQDHSVPFQEWPEQEMRAVWLMPVGYARWQPAPGGGGRLLARSADDLKAQAAFRHYTGVVAGEVAAAAAAIRLRDRGKPYSPVASRELVWVEGDLRVEGDIRPFGTALDFRNANGERKDDAAMLVRRGGAGPGVNELQLVIGDKASATNTLSVGPEIGGVFQQLLTVVANGSVGVGTGAPNPALKLDINGDFGHIDGPATLHLCGSTLSDANNGALSIRSGGSIVAFDGGDRVGIGTAAPDAALLLDIRGDFGRMNGAATLHLFGSQLADRGDGVLSIRSGGGVVAFDGNDNVGLGTRTPVASLQVNGDIAIQSRAFNMMPRALPAGATMIWNDATWLRLNQNIDFSKPIFGVHTPGLFAPGSLNVGGMNVWGDPGFGNAWITGNVGIGHAQLRAAIDVNGNIRLGTNGGLFAPGGAENLRVLRGTVAGGAASAGAGYTVNRIRAGVYDIGFVAPFADQPSAAVTQIFAGAGNQGGSTLDNAVLVFINTGMMRVKVGDSAGAEDDRNFSFVVVGAR